MSTLLQPAPYIAFWPWWLTWAVFLLIFLLLPIAFGWGYGARGSATLRYSPWGAATDALWVALIIALIAAYLVLIVLRQH
ncbi:MAG TPA: hypothetical protein VF765_27560 [Polyangiaceae bacterium]